MAILLFDASQFTNPSSFHGPKTSPTGDQARADYPREICTFLAAIPATFWLLVNLRGLYTRVVNTAILEAERLDGMHFGCVR